MICFSMLSIFSIVSSNTLFFKLSFKGLFVYFGEREKEWG